MLRIAIIQCHTLAAEQAANLETVAAFTAAAKEKRCDIICFGEYMLTGAPAMLTYPASCACQDKTLSALSKLAVSSEMTILAGGIRQSGDELRSSCIVAKKNGAVNFCDKLHPGLPEKSVLSAGEQLHSFVIPEEGDLKFSALLCNDWHQPWCSFLLAHYGVRLFFAPFSTPHEPGERLKLWRRFMPTRAYDCRSFVLACNVMKKNRHGSGEGGGLAAWGPDGEELFSYTDTEPHMQIIDIPLETVHEYIAGKTMKYKDFPAALDVDLIRKNIQ